MPARPYVANVLKVEWTGTTGYYNWAVIHHCSWSGATPVSATLASFATTLAGLWSSDMKAYYNAATVLNSVIMTDLTSATGAQGLDSPNIAGTNADMGTAANAAVLVNYPSSIRYRGGHPRSYWPAPCYGELTDDTHWTAGFITAVGTFTAAVQNDYSTLTVSSTNLTGMCAVSYYTAKALRATPYVMAISNGAYTVVSRIASQRRRIGRK